MAQKWRAGHQNGRVWVPHPNCPGFNNKEDAIAWAQQWSLANPGNPPLTVGSWEEKDA